MVVFAREQLYVTHPLRCFTQPRAKADTVTFEADGNAEWRLLPVAAEVRIGCGVARRLSDAGMAVLDAGTTLPATVTRVHGRLLPAAVRGGPHEHDGHRRARGMPQSWMCWNL